MKILLAVHQFLPRYMSGTEMLTYYVAKELQRRGHEVSVITAVPNSDHYGFEITEYDGLEVIGYHYHAQRVAQKSGNIMQAEYSNLEFAELLEKFLKGNKFDAIHCFHLGRLTSSLIDIANFAGIPIYFTATDFWMICPTNQLRYSDNTFCLGPIDGGANCIKHLATISQPKIISKAINFIPNVMIKRMGKVIQRKWWPEKKFSSFVNSLTKRKDVVFSEMNKVEKIFVPTRFMHDRLVTNGIPSNKLIYQPFGLPFQQHIRQRKTNLDGIRIAYIGTISEHKGLHILLAAMETLPEHEYQLRVYGNSKDFPNYYNELYNKYSSKHNIEFCGTFPNSEIIKILSEVDVLIVPSLWYENTPLVIFSAYAANVPIIASNVPGISEVVKDGYNGLLFDVGDSRTLANKLKQFLDNADLRKRLINNSRLPKTTVQYVDELEYYYGVR